MFFTCPELRCIFRSGHFIDRCGFFKEMFRAAVSWSYDKRNRPHDDGLSAVGFLSYLGLRRRTPHFDMVLVLSGLDQRKPRPRSCVLRRSASEYVSRHPPKGINISSTTLCSHLFSPGTPHPAPMHRMCGWWCVRFCCSAGIPMEISRLSDRDLPIGLSPTL